MRPLIWSGQHCVVVVPLEGEPSVGDILMFSLSQPGGKETNVVHRVVEIRDAGMERLYITRGDNCIACETVRRDEIIGRVAEVHRVSGYRPWHAIPLKQFSVVALPYRIYTRFWMAIWPVRRIVYILRGKLEALGNRYGLIGIKHD
ncbi:MAG: hypothetical protein K2L96_07220 [Muribaculaceae bacterium]|nr:hypothetical protein [Muribaculaceae bacterium]